MRVQQLQGKAEMDRFIHHENIALFRKRLSEVKTEEQRRIILKLLAEEEAQDSRGNSQEVGSAGKSKDAP